MAQANYLISLTRAPITGASAEPFHKSVPRGRPAFIALK